MSLLWVSVESFHLLVHLLRINQSTSPWPPLLPPKVFFFLIVHSQWLFERTDEEGCSKPPSALLLPPALVLKKVSALTTGRRSPVAWAEPARTLSAHCGSLDSDSTAGAHNAPPPSPEPSPTPQLCPCVADSRWGPRLEDEVIYTGDNEESARQRAGQTEQLKDTGARETEQSECFCCCSTNRFRIRSVWIKGREK